MLKKLELTNFRSYEGRSFEFSPSVTLVIGPNASGKTNLLESVYVLASTKSFRAKDHDLVKEGENFFRIVASINDLQLSLAYGLEPTATKKVNHNGVKKTLSGHIGTFQVTLFEPSDLELVVGAPERRRKYLDFILCQTDKHYLATLSTYKRILKQRNRLLEKFDLAAIKDQVFAWDLKLSELAAEVSGRRQALIDFLNQNLPTIYAEIAGASFPISLSYLPSVKGKYADAFLDALTRNLPRDLAAGFTTIGPHREDFKINFKGSDMSRVASRGEVRTGVLAMKLAELAYIETQTGNRPLLLLDDVFSELDSSRRQYLVNKLQGYQAIITTTNADSVDKAWQKQAKIIKTTNDKF